MNHRGLCARVLVLAVLICLSVARAQEVAPPSLPVQEYAKNDKGILVAEVKFAQDGSVVACRVVRSNVPYPLEASTIDFIRRKWTNTFFAGQTIFFPITFDQLPWYAKHWDDPMVPPPNFLTAGDPGRKLKLRITFGKDGWAQHVEVEESSGLDNVDRGTAIWVKVHWHNDGFAGQTMDAPFFFKPFAAPKPAVAKTSKPKPKAKPAAAPEDTAPPAVRVE